MKMRKNLSVMGCILSDDRQNVLLVKRRDVPVWTLPGGGIEKGENFEQAIIREIKEETGFTVEIKRLVGHYFPINKLTKETFLYEAKILGGKASTSDETREVQFFSVSKLPKMMPPPYHDWIQETHLNQKDVIKRKLSSVTYLALLKNMILHPILVFRFLLSRMGIFLNSKLFL